MRYLGVQRRIELLNMRISQTRFSLTEICRCLLDRANKIQALTSEILLARSCLPLPTSLIVLPTRTHLLPLETTGCGLSWFSYKTCLLMCRYIVVSILK